MNANGRPDRGYRSAQHEGAPAAPARHAVIPSLPAAAATYPIARASRARQATEEFQQ